MNVRCYYREASMGFKMNMSLNQPDVIRICLYRQLHVTHFAKKLNICCTALSTKRGSGLSNLRPHPEADSWDIMMISELTEMYFVNRSK